MNFDQSPMLVIWEVTQACDLACVHCRASAQPDRNPKELTTEQGYRLLDEIRSFGEPLMVFTGGDPLKRPDLYDLIRYAVKIGLRTNVTPSATPLLTEEAIDQFKTLNTTVIGVTAGNTEQLADFSKETEHCSGKFAVAADEGAKVAKDYDSLLTMKPGWSNRTSYVIDQSGVVAAAYSAMDPKDHVSQMLAAVKALKK